MRFIPKRLRAGTKKFRKRRTDFAGNIHLGGPLRIVAWPIWSGRERSSHSHLPQVPQTRLAFFPHSRDILGFY